MQKIPLFSLDRQHLALKEELEHTFSRVLMSNQFILGQEVEKLEKTSASLLGVKYALGVSSGTDALIIALMALDIGSGDEVLCPSFTFFATAGSIARIGAIPVFVDIDADTFNINIEDLENKISPKTKAIMPVHLYGQAANMDAIMSIARKHNLFVIEDAAQAIGTTFHGKPVGSLGEFGAFSFFPTKNLGALGDAGLLTTNSPQLFEKAKKLRTHGSTIRYYHEYVGGNFRIDALQAAFLNIKLPHLAAYSIQRQKNAQYYTNNLLQLEGVALNAPGAEKNNTLLLPKDIHQTSDSLSQKSVSFSHIWNQYTIRVLGSHQRDNLKEHLSKDGIGSEIYYPKCLHQQECFSNIIKNQSLCPISEQLSKECLSLPIYPELTLEELDTVISSIKTFLQQSAA